MGPSQSVGTAATHRYLSGVQDWGSAVWLPVEEEVPELLLDELDALDVELLDVVAPGVDVPELSGAVLWVSLALEVPGVDTLPAV